MKKQFCFAGFEDGELSTLRPALAAFDGAWKCVFTPNAATALAALSAAPFDVAVVNVHTDGFEDTSFLKEAAARHPRTLRFVIGDEQDRELVVDCPGRAHQFISRPWQPQELISILERSLAMDAWLSTDKLRAFLPRLGKLPGLPSTYFDVLKRAESPDASVESVARVIARDRTLTSRLMQLANSPAYGLPDKVNHLVDAVSMFGLDAMKSLVLCLQVFSDSPREPGEMPAQDKLWRQSFVAARLASRIVMHETGDGRMAGDAYTAGLLHNVGQTLLAVNLPGEYSEVIEKARKEKRLLREVEMEELGVTHNQVGAYLVGYWGLPLPLVEAIALHDNPSSVTKVEFSVLTALHVAHVLAVEEAGSADGLPPTKLDGRYLDALDLPRKAGAWTRALDAKPPTPEKPVTAQNAGKVSRVFPRVLLGTLLVEIAVTLFIQHQNAAPVEPRVPQLTVVASKTEPTNPAAKAAPAAKVAVATPLDSIRVQGIVYNAGNKVAIINGKMLEVGGRLNGMEVVSISATSVVLSYQGEKKTIRLK